MTRVPSSFQPRRGRPRKFAAAAKAVTVTLPVEVISALTAAGGDLARAIVRLAQPELARVPHPPAELVTFGRYAVIAVTPSKSLQKRTGVSLVPLPDGRALMSFEPTMSISSLELLIADALDDEGLPALDRAIFDAIGHILKSARRSPSVVLSQRSIIVLTARARRARASHASARKSRRRR